METREDGKDVSDALQLKRVCDLRMGAFTILNIPTCVQA